MGVRRAVEIVLDTAHKQDGPVRTFGPLIHNPQVLHIFEEKGITTENDIPENGTGSILIRAHGVPPDIKASLLSAGFKVIDATCPRVIKVQTIIRKHAQKGYAVIIIGDKDHPEVVGLLGYAGKHGHVADSLGACRMMAAPSTGETRPVATSIWQRRREEVVPRPLIPVSGLCLSKASKMHQRKEQCTV